MVASMRCSESGMVAPAVQGVPESLLGISTQARGNSISLVRCCIQGSTGIKGTYLSKAQRSLTHPEDLDPTKEGRGFQRYLIGAGCVDILRPGFSQERGKQEPEVGCGYWERSRQGQFC